MVELTKPFLGLACQRGSGASAQCYSEAVSLWCTNQPAWYRKYVCDALGVQFVAATAADATIRDRSIEEMAKSLVEDDVVSIFLLGDALPLAKAFRQLGGSPDFLTFGRQSLCEPKQSIYFSLWSEINAAAAESNADWRGFWECFGTRLRESVNAENWGRRLEEAFLAQTQHLLPVIERAMTVGRGVRLVDTGMQGTFAISLGCWLQDKLGAASSEIDIRLVTVYPWLRQLFAGRYIDGADTAVLVAIEQMAESMSGHSTRSAA